MYQTLPLLLQEGGGFGVGMVFVILMLLITVGGLVLWLGLSYWTYKDATKRNLDSPGIWAVVVFLTGVFGLIIYFLVRE